VKYLLELRTQKGYSSIIRGIGSKFLTKTGGRRTRAHQGKVRRSRTDQLNGEGGPDEAAAFIAETAADLAGLARRHKLDMLGFLLGMTQLEAEEHLRLRSKRTLS
jgi:Pyruvate/2-oxoacid:ferredoxin oxidoreductase gamma subunit